MISQPGKYSGQTTTSARVFEQIQRLLKSELDKHNEAACSDPQEKIKTIEIHSWLTSHFLNIINYHDTKPYAVDTLQSVYQRFHQSLIQKQSDHNFSSDLFKNLNDLNISFVSLIAKYQEQSTVPTLAALTLRESDIYATLPKLVSCRGDKDNLKYWFIQTTGKHLLVTKVANEKETDTTISEGKIIPLASAHSSYEFVLPLNYIPVYVGNNHYDTETAIMANEAGRILKVKLTSQAIFPQYTDAIPLSAIKILGVRDIDISKIFWHEEMVAINCRFSDIKEPKKCLLFLFSKSSKEYIPYPMPRVSPFTTLASICFPEQPNNIILLNQYNDDYLLLDNVNLNEQSRSTFFNLSHSLRNSFAIEIVNNTPRLVRHDEIFASRTTPEPRFCRIYSSTFSTKQRKLCLVVEAANKKQFIVLLDFNEQLAVKPIFTWLPLENDSLLIGEIIFSPNSEYLFYLTQKRVAKTSTFAVGTKVRCFLTCLKVESMQYKELQIEKDFEKHILKFDNITRISWYFLNNAQRLVLLVQLRACEFSSSLYVFDFVPGLPLPDQLK